MARLWAWYQLDDNHHYNNASWKNGCRRFQSTQPIDMLKSASELFSDAGQNEIEH